MIKYTKIPGSRMDSLLTKSQLLQRFQTSHLPGFHPPRSVVLVSATIISNLVETELSIPVDLT